MIRIYFHTLKTFHFFPLKCDVFHLSISTLLYMSLSLNTGVTCASPHLICHNIFPSVMLHRHHEACPLSNQGRKRRRGGKETEDRNVKLHYGYYVGEVYFPAACRVAHAPVDPNEPLWKQKAGACRPYPPPPPFSLLLLLSHPPPHCYPQPRA